MIFYNNAKFLTFLAPTITIFHQTKFIYIFVNTLYLKDLGKRKKHLIMTTKPEISWTDFEKIDIRCGTILSVNDFQKARNPSYQLEIDFGDLGIRKSAAQITTLYSKEDLVGKQILAVVNFPKKQIANFFSECLVLGVYGEDAKDVTLLSPSLPTKNGLQVG